MLNTFLKLFFMIKYFLDECITFLTQLGFEAGLTVHVFSPDLCKRLVVMTYEGTDPALPSLLLNSHMDVVPVQEVRKRGKTIF